MASPRPSAKKQANVLISADVSHTPTTHADLGRSDRFAVESRTSGPARLAWPGARLRVLESVAFFRGTEPENKTTTSAFTRVRSRVGAGVRQWCGLSTQGREQDDHTDASQ